MTEATLSAVKRSVTVNAPPERAFEVFTAGFSTWWPIESHHVGERPAVEVVIEPRAGGRWFERDAEGTETPWGYVSGWEPPERLVLAWHLTPEYEFDPSPDRSTEVEVRFTPQGGGTLVELEHRGFEKHPGTGGRIRDKVGASGGWGELLQIFAGAF
jgi:uncharacterized protein YndB with AHSA1/START domain